MLLLVLGEVSALLRFPVEPAPFSRSSAGPCRTLLLLLPMMLLAMLLLLLLLLLPICSRLLVLLLRLLRRGHLLPRCWALRADDHVALEEAALAQRSQPKLRRLSYTAITSQLQLPLLLKISKLTGLSSRLQIPLGENALLQLLHGHLARAR